MSSLKFLEEVFFFFPRYETQRIKNINAAP